MNKSYIGRAVVNEQHVIGRVLSKPAQSEGGRHQDILHRAAQLYANHVSREEAIQAIASIYPIGSGTERKITLKELEDAYDGAPKLGYKPWSVTSTTSYRKQASSSAATAQKPLKFQASGELRELPKAVDGLNAIDYLSSIFNEDDWIDIVWADKNGKPTNDEVHALSHWRQIMQQPEMDGSFSAPEGIWYCINPLWDAQLAGAHVSEKDIASHRYLLVELEVKKELRSTLREEQISAKMNEFYSALIDSKLPLAAVYTSGSASLHALVCVNAKGAEEYKTRASEVYEYLSTLSDFDVSNKNASRLSRLPGAFRGEQLQALIAQGVGSRSYEEWQDSLIPMSFEEEDLLSLLQEDPELPDVLVQNWLHKSSIGMLTGSMKTNKSWTLMNLAISLATGTEWLGRQCKQSKVMYFDAEIQREFWQIRFRALCSGLGVDPMEVAKTKRIRPVFIAGKDVSISRLHRDLVRKHNRGELNDVDLIILDPIYQLYEDEWEENSNEDIAKLGRYLRFISADLGIGCVFAHHHTKGSQAGKRDIEKASGGGSFGRFVASSLAITYDEQDESSNKYVLGWTTSHFPKQAQQVAYREGFVWTITDEDPKARKPKGDALNALQILKDAGDAGVPGVQWPIAYNERFTAISNKAFEILRSGLSKAKLCDLSKSDNCWRLTEKGETKLLLASQETDENE